DPLPVAIGLRREAALQLRDRLLQLLDTRLQDRDRVAGPARRLRQRPRRATPDRLLQQPVQPCARLAPGRGLPFYQQPLEFRAVGLDGTVEQLSPCAVQRIAAAVRADLPAVQVDAPL